MTLILSGGAGFLGSHLLEALLGQGRAVTVIDNFDPFYPAEAKRRNLAEAGKAGDFRLVEADVGDADRCLAALALKPGEVEALVHLAARAGPRPSVREPLLYVRLNVGGTVGALELARRLEVPRFIFASSSSVYGARTEVPFREDDPAVTPVSPYAATKRAGELLCYSYHALTGMSVVVLRFFSAYGPRQRPDMAIARFVSLIDQGKPVPVYGDGSASRDHTYVSDIIAGVMSSLTVEVGYEVVNLGDSQAVRLDELIALIEEIVGKRAQIDRRPAQPGDVPVTCADITKARRLLGYDPQVPIAEGLRRYVAWYRKQALPPGGSRGVGQEGR
jgi:UDP-glucuronate 4-epimerase